MSHKPTLCIHPALDSAIADELRLLASEATRLCDTAGVHDNAGLECAADDSDSDSGVYLVLAQDACEKFFELARVQLLGRGMWVAGGASPQERIQHTLNVLGVAKVQP